ncbi:hypothetical protein [Rickettsiales endosymbiont of Stachyamoeba lipophora]|uniref:hypothetical protein n=1 Tax=Rickettsiales endosymbiont of Stachyamoeba lipophora TaxID=2486578 RepID=UPI000F655BD8|nr:hypothetical protein [Rickettsiales endosymbiont of Stachyamoeba lipophora]AZL16238.1 hypothetical protein EF513_06825 [Rickettsiales endosymbiont of Stachyamoeba lipophora]
MTDEQIRMLITASADNFSREYNNKINVLGLIKVEKILQKAKENQSYYNYNGVKKILIANNTVNAIKANRKQAAKAGAVAGAALGIAYNAQQTYETIRTSRETYSKAKVIIELASKMISYASIASTAFSIVASIATLGVRWYNNTTGDLSLVENLERKDMVNFINKQIKNKLKKIRQIGCHPNHIEQRVCSQNSDAVLMDPANLPRNHDMYSTVDDYKQTIQYAQRILRKHAAEQAAAQQNGASSSSRATAL